MKTNRACGSWDSPIGSEDLVRGALRLSAPQIVDGRLFWIEGRPSEGGRQVVMTGTLSTTSGLSQILEASPPKRNVRSRVHEYGGGEYAAWRDRLFFVDDEDGQIYGGRISATRPGASLHSTTRLTKGNSCYADLVPSHDGRWLLAIEERPRPNAEPENRLIAIPLSASAAPAGFEVEGEIQIVAAGHDFYSSPTFSPQDDRVAFLCWDHPNMPWNATQLDVVSWAINGPRSAPRRIVGETNESLFQPGFNSKGELFVVSDRSGWWNLARITDSGIQSIQSEQSEIGHPQWVFGLSRWAFVHDHLVLMSSTRNGRDTLSHLNLRSGQTQDQPTPFTLAGGIATDEGWATCIAGSPTQPTALYVWRVGEASPQCVRESASMTLSDGQVSVAEALEIPSVDGRITHALVYRPRSQSHEPVSGERFPLLVKSHGGPTAATTAALDPRIQFWTSRGFAVADVNYGGSTGYGRPYRDRLKGAWGVVDVEDCVAVANALAAEGLVDEERMAISGGSAGGFTTLCALTFHETFSAGASHYGIGDLEALARDTHKFESRYTDWLVGPLPDFLDRYRARSPIHHHERLECPVIFFQGLEDRVVPPNQAEAMVSVLEKRGIPHAYVPFEGEQHGFRRAENIRKAIDGELFFYSKIFGFEAPQPEGVELRSRRR